MWNNRYYLNSNIDKTVIFSAAFPGLVNIISPDKCSIGRGSVINGNSVLHCAGGVTIGKYVHIGHGLSIYSSNHNYKSLESIPYDSVNILKPVVIGDCIWIGAQVCILPGVKIGDGAIVGMGAVVTRDVPTCAIVGGNPATVLGFRDLDLFEKLRNDKRFF